ncbi:hypothetical protein C8N46_109138 [Kordia periserrulae]|uniref:Uncharacterized protein n=1 Tax=Kordia periserrulae TaxID=701523 RepID=A0A2T6BU09_9FLAO|nr:hypothetical protein [Kordia periserrulae]PTX59549.1 hypothetical protein C8N46_109138 [Kordia periserrulae]
MKKKNLSNLKLRKNIISKLNDSYKVIGGEEKSERRTNCEQCPQTGTCDNTCPCLPEPQPQTQVQTCGLFCSLNIACYI